MVRRVEVHEEKLVLAMRALQRVDEALGDEPRAAASPELVLELRHEVDRLDGGRG